MLTQHDVVPYLLSRELITPQCVVAGNVAVLDNSRRNRNYRIISPDGCYLLKQAVGPDRIETLSREAAIYQQLFSSTAKNGIASHFPGFRAYDSEQHILILELIQDAETLREQLQRLGRVSAGSAQRAAEALAALHQANAMPQEKSARAMVLSLHQPGLAVYRNLSRAALQLIEIIQKQRSLTGHLDELREEWQPSGFIHGDIRAENLLIPVRLGRGKRPVKIVDFEFTGAGDTAWDVGSLFAEYLSFWLSSIPLMTPSQLDRFIHLADCPLENVQPPVRSFWVRYAQCMGLQDSNSDLFLLRAVKFSALRLLLTAFEIAPAASSANTYMLALVQVAMNILAQPEKAAIELFGLSFRHA
ncbi:MAG: aminoglycoside phosphotransferase family protein [Candidatus Acidiferrales bacterium]|jgi:thiamine kinase-like enzyme